MRNYRNVLYLGVCLMPLATTPLHAQSAAPVGGTTTAQTAATGLEDIVVTSRRREERLQDTPISVSVLGSAQLERSNVSNVSSISKLAPNVAIKPQASNIVGITAFIRGIGAQEALVSIDPPVGIYIDGVYNGRNSAANLELVDLERIEVLRGPQGTLFGRNTTGGAISMVTKAPSREFGIEQKVTVASYDEIGSRTRINTGEIGQSGIRATLSYLHRQRDGYYNDPYNSDKNSWGANNTDAVWAKVQGEWGDLLATYTFDWSDVKGRSPAIEVDYLSANQQAYYRNTTGNSFLAQVQPGFHKDYGVITQDRQKARITGHSFTLEYEIADALTLKSITGRRTYRGSGDSNYSPPGIFGPTTTGIQPVFIYFSNPLYKAKQFSEELQALGTIGDFSYVAGLYYFKETTSETTTNRFTLVLSPTNAVNSTSNTYYRVQSKSYAAFGQASWKPAALDDKLEATLGVRYTKDEKEIEQRRPTARTGDRKFSNTSINAVLSYKPVDAVMAYARFGTGYRSGGFNPRASATQSFYFSPEKAKVYELGFKSELFDNRVRLNGSLFKTDYDDLQVTGFTASVAGTGGFTNSARASFRGFELELDAAPVRNVTVRGSVGYVEPKYKEIYFIVPTTPVPGHTPQPGETPGALGNYADISHFPMVPKWTIAGGIQYLGDETSFGKVLLKADANYASRRYGSVINILNGNNFTNLLHDNGSYQVDLRAGLTEISLGNGNQAEVTLFVENLTNQRIMTNAIDFGALGFAGKVYSVGRRVGVDAKISF